MPRLLFVAAVLLFCVTARAQQLLKDDTGRSLMLHPASRIVALAPFLTEAAFAAGVGDMLVAVDPLSDYPPEAARLPKVPTGTAFSVDAVVALKPDLVLAWRDGIRAQDVDRLTEKGITVYLAQARHLEDVPHLLEAIGQFTGRDTKEVEMRFVGTLAQLQRANARKPKMGVFLEIWNRPLTTVSGDHFLSEAVEICRGENVFGRLTGIAPRVDWEEVQQINPFVILGVGSASNAEEFRANWRLRATIPAVQASRLVYLDTEALQRPTVRTPDAIATLCAELDQVRVRFALIAPEEATKFALAGAPAPPVSVLRLPATALERDVAAAFAARSSAAAPPPTATPAPPATVAQRQSAPVVSAAAAPAPMAAAPAQAPASAPTKKDAPEASVAPSPAPREEQPARRARPSQFGM
jgi:iron complex transport system substrate-binding protein